MPPRCCASRTVSPVCIASYAAATIGKTDPIQTGWEAMRLCSIAYIVPFLFVFSPSLLLYGHWYIVTLSVATAVIGSILLGVGMVGFLFRPIGVVKRAFFIIAAVACFPCEHRPLSIDRGIMAWCKFGDPTGAMRAGAFSREKSRGAFFSVTTQGRCLEEGVPGQEFAARRLTCYCEPSLR